MDAYRAYLSTLSFFQLSREHQHAANERRRTECCIEIARRQAALVIVAASTQPADRNYPAVIRGSAQ